MTVLDLNISNGERERETEIHSMTYIYIHAYTVLILIVNDSQGLTRVFFSVKQWCCIDCQVWLPTRRFIAHIYEYIRYKTNNSLHCPPQKKKKPGTWTNKTHREHFSGRNWEDEPNENSECKQQPCFSCGHQLVQRPRTWKCHVLAGSNGNCTWREISIGFPLVSAMQLLHFEAAD